MSSYIKSPVASVVATISIALILASPPVAAQGASELPSPRSEALGIDIPAIPTQIKPVFRGKAAPGEEPGTERWIVHFKTAPCGLEAYQAEMLGDRNPDRVATLVSDIERTTIAGRANFVSEVEALDGTVVAQWWIVNAAAIQIAPKDLQAVEQLDNVAYLQPDRLVLPLISVATNSNNHNSDVLNAQGTKGRNLGVAIIDTSFDDNMNNTGQPHIMFARGGDLRYQRIWNKYQIGSRPFDDPHPHGTGVASIAAGWRWRTATADNGLASEAIFACFSIASYANGGAFLSSMATSYNILASIAARGGIVASNLSYGGSSNPLSIEQKAMDSVALNAGIVNCTAAGNSGSDVSASLANINGLSVGAVHAGIHSLASFSGRGFQGGRYFPNISANGVSVRMARQNNERTDYVGSGTSFASPMVCGGVALIRGIHALTAEETMAVLLAGTEANAGATSTIKVNGVGAGYMKLDRAGEIAGDSSRAGTGTLDRAGATFTRRIYVNANESVQCAIKWLRHDINSTSWANLDLALLRGTQVLVNSNARWNTEELVRYRATQSEYLTLRVTLVGLGSGQSRQKFGWASSLPTGCQTTAAWTAYGQGCMGTSNVPILSNSGLPRLGSSYRIEVSQAKPYSAALVFLGLSDATWLGLNLPFDLTGLRAPGCGILASGEISRLVVIDSSGAGALTITVPNNPTICGDFLYHQAFVIDPGANAIGIASSNAAKATLGK